jgi:hypothetical protein
MYTRPHVAPIVHRPSSIVHRPLRGRIPRGVRASARHGTLTDPIPLHTASARSLAPRSSVLVLPAAAACLALPCLALPLHLVIIGTFPSGLALRTERPPVFRAANQNPATCLPSKVPRKPKDRLIISSTKGPKTRTVGVLDNVPRLSAAIEAIRSHVPAIQPSHTASDAVLCSPVLLISLLRFSWRLQKSQLRSVAPFVSCHLATVFTGTK